MSDYIQSSNHIQLAHDAAVQSMVLLKNNRSTSLPIATPYKKACVSTCNPISVVSLALRPSKASKRRPGNEANKLAIKYMHHALSIFSSS